MLYPVHIHALISLFQIKTNEYTHVINTTLLTLYHSNMFGPSKGHPWGVGLIYFNSRVNKMSYQV